MSIRLRKIYYNEVRMYTKPTIMVEGKTDQVLLENLTEEYSSDLIITYPPRRIFRSNFNAKGVVIGAIEYFLTLPDYKKNRYIGIVDTDFNLLCGNLRHDLLNLFYTDAHDMDTQLFLAVFNKIIRTFYWEPSRRLDVERVKEKCIELAKEFGYYLLSFYKIDKHFLKKEFIPIECYIDLTDLTFSHNRTITKLKELQRKGKISKQNLIEIKISLIQSRAQQLPSCHLVNGHDLIRVLSFLTRQRRLRLQKRTESRSLNHLMNDLEDIFRAAYEFNHFIKTALFRKIRIFQRRTNVIFFKTS